ncbi:MAG: HAMP domain-containing protein [Lachnospiraceae bacterium]|nr:HAMP domain-containing protein [Lachnospiraceae bacterium]
MKHKITYRLIGYFSAVLLLFALIAGSLFFALFTRHTAQIHEDELKNRALSIADTLSQFSHIKFQGRGRSGGYGAYLRFIDDIAMSEAWLVDENAQILQTGHQNSSLSYRNLPAGAEDLIQQVFAGNIVSNREFSPVLDTPSITVGAPVYDADGMVCAALLLHSPITGIRQAQQDGVVILVFCISIALFLALVLSVLLARHFIHPLKKIGMAAEQVMGGDYSARTLVQQNDEIGSLACNIDQLFAQLSEVEQARTRLDHMRQDFISNISHELRTPVTVIKGSLEVLTEGLITDPDEMQEYFHQMSSDTAHLQRLVNDLLELSRLENADFQIEKSELNLIEPLKEAIRSMERIAEQKQVRVIFKNEIGNLCFFGDYGRLRQMFLIIIDNAVKFTPPGSCVTVTLHCREGGPAVSIADQGSGILPEDIPHIFDRFYKERSKQNENGSGLGLPIAKQIASRHDIRIACESNGQDYTVFTFLLNINLSR